MTAELLVNIDVPDLQPAIAFYTRALELRVGRRLGPEVVELLGANAPVYLLQKATGSPPSASSKPGAQRDYARHWTPVHLDFTVADIQAAVRRALDAGAVLEGEIQTLAFGLMATLADPFGHGICLIQFTGRGYGEISEST